MMQDFIFICSICSGKLKVSFVNKSFIKKKKKVKRLQGVIYDFVIENAFCLFSNILKLHEETKRTN